LRKRSDFSINFKYFDQFFQNTVSVFFAKKEVTHKHTRCRSCVFFTYVAICTRIFKLETELSLDDERIPQSLHAFCWQNMSQRPNSKPTRAAASRLSRMASEFVSRPVSDSVKRKRRGDSMHNEASCELCVIVATDSVSQVRPPPRKKHHHHGPPAASSPPAPPAVALVSATAFAKAQIACGMSSRMAWQFKVALEEASAAEGRPVRVLGNIQKAAVQLNLKFRACISTVNFHHGEASATIISDWPAFLEQLCALEKRSQEELESSTWSIDHGGKTLKVTGSFLFEQPDDEKQTRIRYRATGVRKLYCFALVTGVKESHEVVRKLLDLLQLVKLKALLDKLGVKVALVNDIKMCWICTGKSHGGRHSCPWCVWKKADNFGAPAVQRTCADDAEEHTRFLDATKGMSERKAKERAKFFNNCLRPSLIADLCQDNPISNFLWMPPLHLKLRNCNHLLNALRTCAPAVHVAWLASAHVILENYHGELEGGPITKLLNSVPALPGLILEDIYSTMRVIDAQFRLPSQIDIPAGPHLQVDIRARQKSHPARLYPATFAALQVLLQLISQKTFHSEIDAAAERYRDCVLKLGCSVTPAMHIIVDEVPKFCKRMQCGLGFHSEQAAESMHHEEKKYEQRFHVSKVGSVQHWSDMVRVMCALNAEHAVAPVGR